MPKSYRRKTTRSRKGGMFESLFGSSANTGYGSSGYGSSGSSMGSTGSSMGSTGSYGQQPMGYGQQSMGYGQQSMRNNRSPNAVRGYGGRKGKRSMRGGNHSPNMSQTNLASRAAPVSGVQTASAMMVGGRTRRRHRKSCKKSCRKH